MNTLAQTRLQADLSNKLIKAIRDPREWGDVLDFMIERTGAKAIAITLRSNESCRIVNDVELERQYHSPLFRGFSDKGLKFYLDHLRDKDPWADYQKVQPPHTPSLMTPYCPPETVRDTPFDYWLSLEGFDDTVIFELDRMAGYWTAINLLFGDLTPEGVDDLLAFSHDAYDLLRNSWQTSQAMLRQNQAVAALLGQASNGGAPVCLADANGELIECNALFEELITQDVVRLSGNGRKLSFAHLTSVHGLDRWEQHGLIRHDADTLPIHLLATPLDPDPRFADRREQLWLLTCSNYDSADITPSIATSFNLSVLTRQERLLYRAVVSGKPVAEAGISIGLKRSRAFEVWGEVKDKLGITSAHKLRA